MRYLYNRGPGARRRVMHLTPYSPITGEPTMLPACNDKRLRFDTTSNFPFGQRVCKRCAAAARAANEGRE